MKKILILLALLPVLAIGQYQTTNLDFLWNGSYEVVGSDTLLVDSLTGSGDSNYKLNNIDFSLDSNYIPCKSSAILEINGVLVHPISLFPNTNYADTLFTQILEYTENSGGFELNPRRVKRIAHYSTPTIDINDFFQTPAYPFLPLVVPDNYATIALAEAAVTANDTIIVKSGTYTENVIVNVGCEFWAVGNVLLDGTASLCFNVSTSSEVKIKNFEFTTTSYSVRFYGSGDGTMENCYSRSSNAFAGLINGGATYTVKNNYIKGRINVNDNLIATGNYIVPADWCFRLDGFNTYTLTRNKFANDFSSFYSYNGFYLNSNNNTYLAGINYGLIGNDYYSIDSNRDIFEGQFANKVGDGDLSYDSAYFNYVADAGWTYECSDQNSLSITNSTFTQAKQSVYIYATDTAYGVTIDDCNFNSDYGKGYLFDNVSLLFSDNFMTGDSGVVISLTADDLDVLKPQILRNELHHKYGTSPPLLLGESTANPKYYLDSAVIADNLIYGPMYYGQPNNGLHGIFLWSNRYMDIRNNRVIGVPLAYVLKSQGFSMKGTIFRNNFAIECYNDLTLRGVSNITVVHNTFFKDTLSTQGSSIVLATHESVNPSLADTITVKNNIFRNNGSTQNIYSDSIGNLTHSIFNHNNYFGSLNAAYIQGTYYTFTNWQSTFSQDANSFNTNPNLSSGLWPVSPSNAIGNGEFLGSDFRSGLSISSYWTDGIIYDPYKIKVTMGAYTVNIPALIEYNGGALRYNNALIKF